ncbi:MAG TPA: protein phosphatase 2C domain-containing protein [Burkholderiales bacterium]|nr:protein phosphatase 2C domain-containing protein [Burkholderiales bacterium]
MKYALAQATRIGGRKINQDRIGHWSTSGCVLLAVADGLGGHLHGELAAELAMQLLAAAFEREARPRLPDPDAFLVRVMTAGHAAILREAQRRGFDDTPRTVLVACVVQDGVAHWLHIGDSRLYLIRDGRILHRTRDHTVVQALVDAGRIREEAITTHPERNRLLQCLGGYAMPKPDPAERAVLARNDILLLCSDGFWGPLTQRQMLHSLMARQLEPAIDELMELAEVRGGAGCDNISVVALNWQEDAVTAPTEVEHTQVQDLTATDLDYMRVSDEDIDKAIAELKEALRRSSTQ